MSVVTCEHQEFLDRYSVLRDGVRELSMHPDSESAFEGQRSQLQRHAQVQDCCLYVAEYVCQSVGATIHLNVAFMSVGTKSEKVFEQTVEWQVRNDRRQTQTPPFLTMASIFRCPPEDDRMDLSPFQVRMCQLFIHNKLHHWREATFGCHVNVTRILTSCA